MPTLELNTYFGPYYLEKLLAIGGMAEIYLVRTRGMAGFEKQLVLKVIQPDFAGNSQFVQMLVDEAKIAVGLNHPNIAQTFDLGKIGNCYFISMEYVDGQDFFQILKRLGEMQVDLPIETAVHVVHETLAGLDHAHKKCDAQGNPLHIIHRDISPQNILLSRHGEVKIVDFGIAKAANLSHKTRAGVIKGKLVYMSPEQAWGDPVDHRADVFSAGIVLYEALTMGSLYLEKNPARLLERVRKAAIDPPSYRRAEIPAELDEIVMKALRPRPADRFQSAQEFAETLMDFQRRTAPDFTEQNLAAIVEAVLAGEKPALRGRPQVGQTGEIMVREDFAVHEHSMIFSAEEMMDSAPVLPSHHKLITPSDVQRVAPQPGARVVLLDERDPRPQALGEQFTIGRSGDLRLADARVSRRHACIRHHGGGVYVIEDLQSSNGTWVNGVRIEAPTTLHADDVIRVGPFEMKFLQESGEEAAQPAAASAAQAAASAERAAAPARAMVAAPALGPTGEEPALEEPAPEDIVSEEPAPEEVVGEEPASADLEPSPAPDISTEDGATVALLLGNESLTLPVGDRLLLGHALTLVGTQFEGEGAALVRRGPEYWLEPSPGSEPVLHNGRRLVEAAPLSSGDRVTVGPLELQFHLLREG